MKSLIKLVFIFFALMISFCINPQSDSICDFQTANFIQNDYQKIVLVSNPIRGSEIAANESDSYSNLTGSNESAAEIVFTTKDFNKNYARTNRESIHNISTDLKNDISIRAP